MRKLFIIIFILPAIIYAQNGIAVYDIKLAEDNFYFTGKLYFGETISTFVSKQNNSKNWNIKKKESGGEYAFERVYTDTIGHTITSGIKSSMLEVRDFCEAGKPILYQDKVTHHWKLYKEVKIIANYKCHKATTNFRGRKYVAWYTTDIPVNFGPWKFKGLPGLILEVTDKSKEVLIQLTNLSLNVKKNNVKSKNGEENQVVYSNFVLCLEESWKKSLQATKAKFAKLQAKHPNLEIELETVQKRVVTELSITE